MDGTACELPQFKEMLAQAVKGRENVILLTVQADPRCVFEHLSAVLAVCRELDVPHVRIAALGE